MALLPHFQTYEKSEGSLIPADSEFSRNTERGMNKYTIEIWIQQFKEESGKCVNKAKKETSSDSAHVLLRNMNTLTNFNTQQKR